MLINTGDVQPFCQLYPDLKKAMSEEITTLLAQRLKSHKDVCGTAEACSCFLNTNEQVALPEGIPLDNINLQVKLFISDKTTQEDVNKAVDAVMNEFSAISQINYLFLATPDQTNKDLLLKCWPWFEELATSGKVANLGLSDPRCQTLQPLIENCKIRPAAIQLKFVCEHISDTCIDLLKLANYYKIRVTIHRDDLTSVAELRETLKPAVDIEISESWLAKYILFETRRKVILKKGYIVELEKIGGVQCVQY